MITLIKVTHVFMAIFGKAGMKASGKWCATLDGTHGTASVRYEIRNTLQHFTPLLHS